MSCFSLNFYPLVLASIDNSCLNYYNICQMVSFFFSKFIYYLALSTVLKSFCFLTFIYFLVYFYPCVLMYSHFTQWVTLTELYSVGYILVQWFIIQLFQWLNCHSFGQWEYLSLGCCGLLTNPHDIFYNLLF